MAGLNCEIRWETRLCEVDGELGYFHCWEHWSNVIDASPLRVAYERGKISYNDYRAKLGLAPGLNLNAFDSLV